LINSKHGILLIFFLLGIALSQSAFAQADGSPCNVSGDCSSGNCDDDSGMCFSCSFCGGFARCNNVEGAGNECEEQCAGASAICDDVFEGSLVPFCGQGNSRTLDSCSACSIGDTNRCEASCGAQNQCDALNIGAQCRDCGGFGPNQFCNGTCGCPPCTNDCNIFGCPGGYFCDSSEGACRQLIECDAVSDFADFTNTCEEDHCNASSVCDEILTGGMTGSCSGFGQTWFEDRCGNQSFQTIDVECSVTDACAWTDIFWMSDNHNAHAEYVFSDYAFSACCQANAGAVVLTTSTVSGDTLLLSFSNTTNAHVERPGESTYTNLYVSAAGRQIDCDFIQNDTCPANYTCVAAVSNLTNAHVQGCGVVYDNSSDLILLLHFDNESFYNETTDWNGYIHDFSGRGNEGTIGDRSNLSSHPTWVPNGMFGGAFYFDGIDDTLLVDHSADFEIDQGTYSLWFKPILRNSSYSRDHPSMFSKDHVGYVGGGHIYLRIENDTLDSRMQNSTDVGPPWPSPQTGTMSHIYSPTGSVQNDTWQHATVTFGPNGHKIYVNGILVDQNLSWTTGWQLNTWNITIGSNTYIRSGPDLFPLLGFYKGLIDEVHFWNVQLTDQEVRNHYLNTVSTYEYIVCCGSGSDQDCSLQELSICNASGAGCTAHPYCEGRYPVTRFPDPLGGPTMADCLGNCSYNLTDICNASLGADPQCDARDRNTSLGNCTSGISYFSDICDWDCQIGDSSVCDAFGFGCTADAQCHNFPPNRCVIGGRCNDTCSFYDYDSNSQACGCMPGYRSGDWLDYSSGADTQCCGDDGGEDFEQISYPDRQCCYNNGTLMSGTDSDAILCCDGELYDCCGLTADDSGLSEHIMNQTVLCGLQCNMADCNWTNYFRIVINNEQEWIKQQYTNDQFVSLSMFVINITEVDYVRYANDLQPWSNYEPYLAKKGWQLSAGDGNKTVRYDVVNSTGQHSEANDTIVLDETPPKIDMIWPTPGTTVRGTFDVNFTLVETNPNLVRNVYYSIDGGVWTDSGCNSLFPSVCTVVLNSFNYEDSTHTIQFKFPDLANNSGLSDVYVFTVLNNMNNIVIIQPHDSETIKEDYLVDTITPSSTMEVRFYVYDSAGNFYDLDGNIGLFSADVDGSDGWSGIWDRDSFPTGLYNLTAVAYEKCFFNGTNCLTTTDTNYNIIIDHDGPIFTITNQPAYVNGVITLEVIPTDPSEIATFDVEYESGASFVTLGSMTKSSSQFLFSFDTTILGDGWANIRIVGTDLSGNNNSQEENFTIDNTGPSITITAPPIGSIISGNMRIDFIAADAGVGEDINTFQISLDNSAWGATDDTAYHDWDTLLYINGAHLLELRVQDALGNYGSLGPVVYNIYNGIDPLGWGEIVPEYVRDGSYLEVTYYGGGINYSVDFSASAVDSNSVARIPMAEMGGGIYQGNHTISLANTRPDGEYSIIIYVNDTFNNSFVTQAFVKLDNSLPVGSIEIKGADIFGFGEINDEVTSTQDVTLFMQYDDPLANNVASGVKECRFSNSYLSDVDFAINYINDSFVNITNIDLATSVSLNPGVLSGVAISNLTTVEASYVELSAVDSGTVADINLTEFDDSTDEVMFLRSGEHIVYLTLPVDAAVTASRFNITNVDVLNDSIMDSYTQNDSIISNRSIGYYFTPSTTYELGMISYTFETVNNGNLIITSTNRSDVLINDTFNCLADECNITLSETLEVQGGQTYFIHLISPTIINITGNDTEGVIYHYNSTDWVVFMSGTPTYENVLVRQAGDVEVWLGYNYSSAFTRLLQTTGNLDFSAIISGFNTELMDYLGHCQIDPCPVPFVIKSGYPGQVSLFDVSINYSGSVAGVRYYVSNDDGTSWVRIIDDANFPNRGNQLLLRADLWRNQVSIASPTVTSAVLSSKNVTWETCVGSKPWILDISTGDGLKTVYYQIIDEVGNIISLNDTIEYSRSGRGLDTTPPLTPVVYDDGRWSNSHDSLHARWINGTDDQNRILGIPMRYRYRIMNATDVIYPWTETEDTDVTVTGLNLSNNDTFVFEVKAVNAAELESVVGTSNGITVDLVEPWVNITSSTHSVILSRTNYTIFTDWEENSTVLLNWSGIDNVSGVLAYSLVFDDRNDTQPDNIPEGVIPYDDLVGVEMNNVGSGTYYLHVKAIDNALNWGEANHYQINIDLNLGVPGIVFIRPRGLTVDVTPELYAITDELAICEFQINDTTDNDVSAYYRFPTDSSHIMTHIAVLDLIDEHNYDVWLNCSDVVGNYNDTILTSFLVNSSGSPSSIDIINLSGTCVAGSKLVFYVNVSYNGGTYVIGLEGLSDMISVLINDSYIESYVFDLGEGMYETTTTCPGLRGNYTLNASVGEVSDTASLDVTGFAFTVEYGTNEPTTLASNIYYKRESGFTIGVAAEDIIYSGAPGLHGSQVDGAEGGLYVFVTSPSATLVARDNHLSEDTFMDLSYPSFGLPLTRKEQVIGAVLEYDDIVFEGDVNRIVGDGQYTLILQRKENRDGKKIIYVKIV